MNKYILDQLRNDPFIKKWQRNYLYNLESGIFSDSRSRPLMFIVNTQPYGRRPAVLAAAGPSLNKNIHVVKKYRNRFLLFCADVIAFKFVENGIIPDFVVNIDPNEDIVRYFSDVDTSNLILVCPTSTSPNILSEWKGRIIFFNQVDLKGTPKGEALAKLIVPTAGFGNILNRYFVGATMFQIALHFFVSHVILIGYDFGFTDEKAYCDGVLERKLYTDLYEVGTKEYDEVINWLKESEIKRERKVTVDGKEIWTTDLFLLYKSTLLNLISKSRVPVTNATEGGILYEVERMSLEDAVNKYCPQEFDRVDVFTLPKRQRKRKRSTK